MKCKICRGKYQLNRVVFRLFSQPATRKVGIVIIVSSRAIYGEGKYHCTAHGDVYPTERKNNILIPLFSFQHE